MASVYDEITRLQGAKEDIEAAIEYCGVNVDDDALISTYADRIRAIPSTVLDGLDATVGNATTYIKSITQTDGLISAETGGVFGGSGTNASIGLVPKPSTTAGTTKYLREDGTWTTPPNTNTWRAIKVNDTQILSTGTNTGAINFKASTNITLSNTNGTVSISARDTTYAVVSTAANGLAPRLSTAASSTIATQATEWVLTSTEGATPTWRKLPANAFKNDNTTYSTATTTANGLMSSTDKTKLNGIATGAEVNVQSDWSVSDTTSDAYIKNKPTIPTVNNKTIKITVNGTEKGSFTLNQSSDATIALSDTNTTYAVVSTTANGLAPKVTDTTKYLRGDGTWATPTNTTYNAATQSAAGLMSAADKTKLDGITTGANKYTLPAASTSALGGIKVGYTTSGKNYKVQLDSSNNAYVNVPWTDNNTTYSAGTNISINASNVISAVDTTYSAATSNTLGLIKIGYTTSGKNYKVQLDSNNNAYVNVPWTDNNTTYSAGTNITISGTTISATDTTYSAFKGATASAAGSAGLVPAPATSNRGQFLKGDGTWATPTNTTYSVATTTTNGLMSSTDKTKLDGIAAGAEVNVQSDWNATSGDAFIKNKPTIPTVNNKTITITVNGTEAGAFTLNQSSDETIALTNTTYSNMTGATASAAGKSGLVPAPAAGNQGKFLKGDGTWATPTNTNTWRIIKVNGTQILSNTSSTALDLKASTNVQISNNGGVVSISATDTTYVVVSTEAAGLAPVISTNNVTISSQSEEWVLTTKNAETPIWKKLPTNAFNNTTYSNMKGATSTTAGAAGLVPAPAIGNRSQFLRGDGSWATPTNTTYSNATQSAAGLMSASDKTKLDGIASGANSYSLPLAANGTRGGVQIGYSDSGANVALQLSSEKGFVALTKTAVTSALGYTPPTSNTNYYHTRSYSSGLKISTGTGVSDMYVPTVTTSRAGVMSAADKTKLDGIATGANKYTLPTASTTTLGGIKVGTGLTISSSVLSISCTAGSGDFDRPIVLTNASNGLYYTNTFKINYSTGKVTATGSIYAASFYENSDRNLKENIQVLSSDLLDKVYNVKEVSFDWKKTKAQAFGYIAQDFENISETFIGRNDDGTLSLNYTEVLVAQIAALKQKIANLEQRINCL